MRIATWNINAKGGVRAAREEAIFDAIVALAPDVLALQEVSWKKGLHDAFAARLLDLGWPHSAYSGVVDSPHLQHGTLIASRYPLGEDPPGWAPGLPFDESALRVTVDAPPAPFSLISTHVPNGGGNGWIKIDAFEALAGAIARQDPATPLVVVGDFNEPELVLPDGAVIPFTMYQNPQGEWVAPRTKTARCGNTFPGSRWVDGVRALLGQEPVGGLRHVSRVTEGAAAWHTTHRVRGRDRFFDHILVSSAWDVTQVGYDHGVRDRRTSDHSLVWADLEVV